MLVILDSSSPILDHSQRLFCSRNRLAITGVIPVTVIDSGDHSPAPLLYFEQPFEFWIGRTAVEKSASAHHGNGDGESDDWS